MLLTYIDSFLVSLGSPRDRYVPQFVNKPPSHPHRLRRDPLARVTPQPG